MPNVRDLEKNISLILINSHRSVDLPRPSMPGLIDVGGAHIQKAKTLPDNIKVGLNIAENHIKIFFNFSTSLTTLHMVWSTFRSDPM